MAESTQLPLPVVSKILKSLAREACWSRTAAPRAATAWRADPAEILVTEMIGALEGPFGLTECATHPGTCPQEPSCDVREPWQRINFAVHDALARITLADLVAPLPGSIVPLESLGVDTSDLDTPPTT